MVLVDENISEFGDLIFYMRCPPEQRTSGACRGTVKPNDELEEAIASVGLNERAWHVAFIVRQSDLAIVRSPDLTAEVKSGHTSSSPRLVHALPGRGVVVDDANEVITPYALDCYEIHAVHVSEQVRREALRWACSHIGAGYNQYFEPNASDKQTGGRLFYCSELVVEAYAHAGLHDLCPPPHTLRFTDSHGAVLPYWKQYYGGRPVPEGLPGTHPATLIGSPYLHARLKRTLFNAEKSMRFCIPKVIDEALHFVGGASMAPLPAVKARHFDVIEPRSGKIITQCACAPNDLIDAAIKEARQVQPKWAIIGAQQRAEVLRKAAIIIREYANELARIETIDCGKPLAESKWDINSCAETFEFFSGTAQNIAGEHFPLSDGHYAYTVNEPWGVVAAISVWNYPVQTASWKIAPALMCGNAVIHKPSPLAPITSNYLAQILQAAGLPDGLLSIVQGDGETGKTLCEHAGIDKVTFTGSSETGAKILASCSLYGRMKPATLELGGKSACIIFADADIEMAVTGALMANFYSQGEVCSNASKILVHRSIFDEFRRRVIAATQKIVVGDPLQTQAKMGAMISREHLNKIKSFISEAREQGANLLCGGEEVKVNGLEEGFYLSPAVMDNITENMRIYKDEIFGPVMLLIPFETNESALKMANDTPYGLAAGVFTKDLNVAYTTAAKLHAGNVYVNTFNDSNALVPFGGMKQSGFGRENGVAALHVFSQIKSVFVNASNQLVNTFA